MLLYFCVIIFLEIILIFLAYKDKKYSKFFNGLFFGFYISICLYCIYSYTDIFSYDTGEWVTLEVLMQSAFLGIINLIIGVIGLIVQIKAKKNQTPDTSKKLETFKCFFIFSLITFFIITTQYTLKKYEKIKIEDEIKNETISYLKNKYGSSDFEIVDIDRKFVENGFIGTDLLNYKIYAVYIPDNIRFYIELDVDNSRNILKDSFDDRLISTNYSEKYFKDTDFINDYNKAIKELNIYLNKLGFNVNVDLFSKYVVGLANNKAVPNDYGRIPSKDELYNLILDYHIKHDFKIEIDKEEIKSDDLKSEVRKYLINLSKYLIDYYKSLDDYRIECHYNDNNGNFFKGSLIINKEYIVIHGNLIDEKIKK